MAVSALKYYLHDGAKSFRIQLLGTLSQSDLRDLSGCWRTARSSVARRAIVVDAVGLKSVDSAGRSWLEEMIAEGAIIEDQNGEYSTVPPRLTSQETVKAADMDSTARRKWGKFRVPAIDSM
jgi:ABC-type transporter Mla MlaB component